MNLIAAFFSWIFDPHPQAVLRREEDYLAQSVDMCDLERRMRELDRPRFTDAVVRTV